MTFGKIRMIIFIVSPYLHICNKIEEGHYIPFVVINGVRESKLKIAWNDDDKKNVQYVLKAKKYHHFNLGIDEFINKRWDTLETTREGTEEVKCSRLNTISQEYEIFCMAPEEVILNLQKRFTHLTNHLITLGKVLSNNDLNLKVLGSLTRTWQPKMTTIFEKKSLSKISLVDLFLENYKNTSWS
ncbi:hypothetical protein Lal_00021414 [Lupinus albus]|nr:hypothetical protein Lal_00021414 [Lupinus albus]